ncbi:MAG: AbrB/MazE/SpoVT family DNA-binding domain-containing protein [Gemmatimonadaceae bacterium]
MASAKLTSKGQITVPKDVREALGVQTGDRIAFTIRRDGTVTVAADIIDIRSLRGSVKSDVRGVTVEAMDEAIRRSASRK